MFDRKSWLRHSLPILANALVLAVGYPSVTAAASACQGLSQSACAANPSCSWMEGYTRKDGVKVSAYCRSKGQAKGATEGAAQSQSAPAVKPQPATKASGAAAKATESATGAAGKATPPATSVPPQPKEATKKAAGALKPVPPTKVTEPATSLPSEPVEATKKIVPTPKPMSQQ